MSEKVMHTPAPWGWYWHEEDGQTNCGVNHFQRDGSAYSICRAPRYQTKEQWEADARLIAAAPDLLEALQGMVSLAELMNDVSDEGGLLDDRHDAALAAIAKATGAP